MRADVEVVAHLKTEYVGYMYVILRVPLFIPYIIELLTYIFSLSHPSKSTTIIRILMLKFKKKLALLFDCCLQDDDNMHASWLSYTTSHSTMQLIKT